MGSHSAGDRGTSPPPPPQDTTQLANPARLTAFDYPMPTPTEFRTANPYPPAAPQAPIAPAAPVVPVKRKTMPPPWAVALAVIAGVGAGAVVTWAAISPTPQDTAAIVVATPTVTETVTKSPKPSPSSSSSVRPGFGDGTYVVGEDIKAGRYTTAETVGEGCYWEISESGTNGGKIIENDFSPGGVQVVTLSKGQDFQSEDCGKWVRK